MSVFLKPNNPLLNKVSKEIPTLKIISPEIQKDINRMLKIALTQKGKGKPTLVGLAAVQIGILKRIILVDVAANGKGHIGNIKVYINPKITWASKRKEEWYEGCFLTSRVCGIVSRPISIKIQAFTLQAKLVTEKYTGYVARIFQHEIDHLNGKVFVDLIKNPNDLHWVKKSEFPLYRNQQAWRNWPKKCSFERWQKVKNPLLN